MNKSKMLAGFIAVALAALGTVSCSKRRETSSASMPSPVRVEALLPLTGPSAFLGDFCRNGMQLAVDEVNAKGGVNGGQLQLVFADTKNDPKEGIAAFQKAMIAKPAAVIVAMSSVASAVAPLADSEKIPLFATMVSSKGATENHPSMFRLFINADVDARLMARFAAEKAGFKSVAIISVNDEMGESFSAVFSETLAASRGKVPIHERFDKAAADFRDVAAKVKSVPSDAIYLLGYDKNLGQLAKTLREQGVTQPFLSIATIAQDPVRAAAGEALNGTFFTSVDFDAESPRTPVAKSFVAAYKQGFGKNPTYFSAFSYDAVLLLAEAIRKKGPGREQVIEGLRGIDSFEGATGTLSFGGTRDARFGMLVKKIVDGAISDAK